jgi:hypothetical protein
MTAISFSYGTFMKKEFRALLEFIKECYPICDLETFAQRVVSRLSKIGSPTATIHREMKGYDVSRFSDGIDQPFDPTLKHMAIRCVRTNLFFCPVHCSFSFLVLPKPAEAGLAASTDAFPA